MYRYSLYFESEAWQRFAKLATAVAVQRLGLPYDPEIRYIKEDPGGRFEKPVPCRAFIDFMPGSELPAVFIRARSPSETANSIFHEVAHCLQFYDVWANGTPALNSHLAESQANLFAAGAPCGTLEQITRRLHDELELPTYAEAKAREHALNAIIFSKRAGAKRIERALEQAKYRMAHWREIQAEEEEKRRRKIERFVAEHQARLDEYTKNFLW